MSATPEYTGEDAQTLSSLETLNEKPTTEAAIKVNSSENQTQVNPINKEEKEIPALDPGAPAADQSNVLPFRQLIVVFIGLAMAMFLSAFDVLIVTTAGPKIVADLNGLSLYSWIFNAYQLTTTSLMPVYGRFSDIFGRKPIILFAIAIFEIGSLLAGISRTMTELIIFRAIQGVGSAGIQAMVFVIIADIVSLRERGKYMGIVGSVWGLAGVLGPMVGGALSDHVTWRWCFFINIPIGVVSFLVIFFFLKLKSVPGDIRSKLLRVDVAGTLALVSAITLILLPTIWGGATYAWSSPIEISIYCVAAVVIVIFFVIETYAKEPIIPFRIFRNRSSTACLVANFSYGGVLFGMISYISVYFQVARGDTATTSGLELVPWVLALVITGIISGLLTTVFGIYRPFIWIGSVLLTVGLGLIYMWDLNTSKAQIVGELIFQGISLGLLLQILVLSIQASADYKDIAIITSLGTFFRTIGSVIATSVCSAIFNTKIFDSLQALDLPSNIYGPASTDPLFVYSLSAGPLRDAITDAYIQAIRLTFIACVPFGILCFISSLFIKHYPLRKTLGPAAME